MKVAFFTDSIQFEPSHIPPLVFIGFSIFWLVLSFLGFLLPKNPLIDRWKLPLTLVSFLPFSFLCYTQSKTATNPLWEGKIQKDLSIVSLYDTVTQNTLEFSFSEFRSYIIESSQESKKNETIFTDTVYLRHISGLQIPVGKIETKESNNKRASRYAELSRNMRRYQKILNLPIKDIFLEDFNGLLLSDKPNPEISYNSLPINPKIKIEKDINFPIRWKENTNIANFYFIFFILSIGHFALVVAKAKSEAGFFSNASSKKAIGLGILSYLGAIAYFYFIVYLNYEKVYEIRETTSGYEFSSSIGENPPFIEGSSTKGSGQIVSLQFLPELTLEWISPTAFEAERNLKKSLGSGDIGLSKTFTEVQAVARSANQRMRWDLSDLPMEVAVRFFLVLSQN